MDSKEKPQKPKLLIDRLPEHFTGLDMMHLVEKLRQSPCKITLDGSRVASFEATGLEALLVIAETQRDRGNGFAIENPSDALLADLGLLGVEPDQLKGP